VPVSGKGVQYDDNNISDIWRLYAYLDNEQTDGA
jgi:hypothetical protein